MTSCPPTMRALFVRAVSYSSWLLPQPPEPLPMSKPHLVGSGELPSGCANSSLQTSCQSADAERVPQASTPTISAAVRGNDQKTESFFTIVCYFGSSPKRVGD